MSKSLKLSLLLLDIKAVCDKAMEVALHGFCIINDKMDDESKIVMKGYLTMIKDTMGETIELISRESY